MVEVGSFMVVVGMVEYGYGGNKWNGRSWKFYGSGWNGRICKLKGNKWNGRSWKFYGSGWNGRIWIKRK